MHLDAYPSDLSHHNKRSAWNCCRTFRTSKVINNKQREWGDDYYADRSRWNLPASIYLMLGWANGYHGYVSSFFMIQLWQFKLVMMNTSCFKWNTYFNEVLNITSDRKPIRAATAFLILGLDVRYQHGISHRPNGSSDGLWSVNSSEFHRWNDVALSLSLNDSWWLKIIKYWDICAYRNDCVS